MQEIKCSKISQNMKNDIWDYEEHGWAIQESEGAFGGLITSWDKDLFEEINVQKHRTRYGLIYYAKKTSFKFHCVNVYAPQEPKEKRDLWDNLSSVHSSFEQEPICFLGDFNAVRSNAERKNCEYRRADTRDFDLFVKNINLLEAPFIKGEFTQIIEH